ncbi:MAG: hypothetical protein QXD03_03760 [Candidatus Anstonellales archaeon]
MEILRPEDINRSRSVRVYSNRLRYHINMGFVDDKLFSSWEDFRVIDNTGFEFIKNNYDDEIISFTSNIFIDIVDFDQTGFTHIRDDYSIPNPIFYEPHIRSYVSQ